MRHILENNVKYILLWQCKSANDHIFTYYPPLLPV